MRKLEEITGAEEQRIEKAEKDLEEDAVRFGRICMMIFCLFFLFVKHMFDQFLAANNKNANEAARL